MVFLHRNFFYVYSAMLLSSVLTTIFTQIFSLKTTYSNGFFVFFLGTLFFVLYHLEHAFCHDRQFRFSKIRFLYSLFAPLSIIAMGVYSFSFSTFFPCIFGFIWVTWRIVSIFRPHHIYKAVLENRILTFFDRRGREIVSAHLSQVNIVARNYVPWLPFTLQIQNKKYIISFDFLFYRELQDSIRNQIHVCKEQGIFETVE